MMMEAQGKGGKGKAVELEDMKFHQCVRLARFDADKTVSFIPPDGAFDLLTYRLSTAVKPLFWAEAVVEKHGTSRVEYMVKLRSQFKEKSTATGVVVTLPVPADATNPVIRTNAGAAEYAPEVSVQRGWGALPTFPLPLLTPFPNTLINPGRGAAVENQVLPGRQGVPAARQVFIAVRGCRRGRRRQGAPTAH